jgi:uncharacterized membrane protein YeaQ/YmgE (transglycosylase-associated protein family)
MSFFAWILLGLIAGFLGSKIIHRRGEGVFVDILLGIAGAVAGGYLFEAFGQSGITGFNVWSIFVATAGAILVLISYHAVRGLVGSNR